MLLSARSPLHTSLRRVNTSAMPRATTQSRATRSSAQGKASSGPSAPAQARAKTKAGAKAPKTKNKTADEESDSSASYVSSGPSSTTSDSDSAMESGSDASAKSDSTSHAAAEAKDADAEHSSSTPSYLADPERFLHSYPVTVNEVGVLTVEPYKSALLPLWRFRTPDVARESSAQLEERFAAYGAQRDFVGMDMARKFIQMGMTRAKRYANYKGGRKYVKGEQLEKSQGHKGQGDKEEASQVFRTVWERCKRDEVYLELKEEFVLEKKRVKGKK